MFFGSIKSVVDLFSKLFDWQTVKIEHQTETEVLKEKRYTDEAVKAALRALKIADKYRDYMTMKDRFLFKHSYNDFLREK